MFCGGVEQRRHLSLGQPDGTVCCPQVNIGTPVVRAVKDQFAGASGHLLTLAFVQGLHSDHCHKITDYPRK